MNFSFRMFFLGAILMFCTDILAQTAELFAPSVISSENPEFGATLTPDGRTFFFNRTTPDRRLMYLMVAQKQGKLWQSPTIASFTDTTYREIDPFVSPDGKRLFFSSRRPITGMKDRGFDVWVCEKKGKNWQNPTPLNDDINTVDDEVFVSTSENGNLYFARFVNNKSKLFCAKWVNEAYQKAEMLQLQTDTASISNPAISPDESMLVFASRELDKLVEPDLYLCRREANGQWSKPKKLNAPINSSEADFAPYFSPDGKFFYWTSERPGVVQDFPKGQRRPGDIYKIPITAVR